MALCVAGTPAGARVARVVEKPEVVGAAVVDLVIEQLQRNECGLPPDAKEMVITGQWVDGATVRTPVRTGTGATALVPTP